MSRILDNSAITDLAQLPYKKGTVKFLQDSHKIDLANVVSSLLNIDGVNTTAYVLYGCINTGTYPAYNISDGVIYYGGEIYNVAASSFTATGSNVAVLKLVVTQYTTDADPVTFTDSVARNVHNIRTLNFIGAASGSGIVDYTALIFPVFSLPQLLAAIAAEENRAVTQEGILSNAINTLNNIVTGAWTDTVASAAIVVAHNGNCSNFNGNNISFKQIGDVGLITFNFQCHVNNVNSVDYIDIICPFNFAANVTTFIYCNDVSGSIISAATQTGTPNLRLSRLDNTNFANLSIIFEGTVTAQLQ